MRFPFPSHTNTGPVQLSSLRLISIYILPEGHFARKGPLHLPFTQSTSKDREPSLSHPCHTPVKPCGGPSKSPCATKRLWNTYIQRFHCELPKRKTQKIPASPRRMRPTTSSKRLKRIPVGERANRLSPVKGSLLYPGRYCLRFDPAWLIHAFSASTHVLSNSVDGACHPPGYSVAPAGLVTVLLITP